MNKKLLIIEELEIKTIEIFSKNWADYDILIDYNPNLEIKNLKEFIVKGKYDAIIVRNKVINRDLIEAWSESKNNSPLVIVRAGSNISTIDVVAAKEIGVKVMNTPGANSHAVAQYIISQLFMLTQNVQNSLQADEDIKNNNFKHKSIYDSHTFTNDTIAVIGTGYIGSKVARIASSLGMKVKVFSPHLTEEKAISINALYCKSIEEAVEEANFLSIQVPYTLEDSPEYPKTYGIINENIFNLMAKDAKIISVSRKDVINVEHLSKAIKAGKIYSVSLDLLASEIKDLKEKYPEIINDKKNIITPLIACESHKADVEITTQALTKVEEFFKFI